MFDDPKKLYFFFDYISHNAYLAWYRLPAFADEYGLTIEPVPVLFAAMLSHYKQMGPAEIPAKSRWMLWNVLRKAKRYDIPIAPPHTHPFNPLLPLRLSCAVDGPDRVGLVDHLFRATWAESVAVSDPEAVRELLLARGMDADAALARAGADAAKQRLRQNTNDALAAGVFGVPAMIVRGELFWGFDDLENMEIYLQGQDELPEDRSELDAWTRVRPSAERSR